MYWGQVGTGGVASQINPVTRVSVRYPWIDLNGDKFVQANEVQLGSNGGRTPLAVTGNWDPNNPTAVTTANTVDPNLKNDRTDEFIVGFDHEIAPGFAAGASYIWRRYGGFQFTDVLGLQSSDYTAVQYTPAAEHVSGLPGGAVPDGHVLSAAVPAADHHQPHELHHRSVQPDVQRPRAHRAEADVASLADEHQLRVQQHRREQRVPGHGEQHRQ